MSIISELFVKLGLKKEGFDKGLDSAKAKTTAFGGAVGKIGGIIAGAFAVGQISAYIQAAVRAYGEQEQAEKSLLTALKGRADIQKRLLEDSESLAKTTLFGDDAIIGAYASLSAFTKNEAQLKKLMPLVADFATAMGTDLGSAAKLMGKTLGSSTNALARYGLEVKGAAGSSERLESIVAALNERFGGQAAAAAKTGTGAIIQLRKAWGELQEEIGRGLVTPIGNQAEGLKSVVEQWTKDVSDIIYVFSNKNISALQRLGIVLDKGLFGDTSGKFIEEQKALEKTIDDYSEMESLMQGQAKLLSGKKPEYYTTIAEQVEWLKEEIKAANEELRRTPPGEEWQQQKDKVDALTESLKKLQVAKRDTSKIQTLEGARGVTFGERRNEESKYNLTDGLFDTTGDQMFTDATAGMLVGLDSFFAQLTERTKAAQGEYGKVWDDFNMSLNDVVESGFTDVITTMAEGLGELAAGTTTGKDFGNNVLKVIGGFMKQLGTLMIAYAIHEGKFAESIKLGPLGWPLALAAGVAMVAAGAAISGLASKGLGGSSTSASGYSNYSASSGTQALQGNVVFELEGTKLKGVLANTDRKNQSYR